MKLRLISPINTFISKYGAAAFSVEDTSRVCALLNRPRVTSTSNQMHGPTVVVCTANRSPAYVPLVMLVDPTASGKFLSGLILLA